jgi:hypothetical protein
MSFLGMLFGRSGDREARSIPESNLAADTDIARSLIMRGEMGATAIGSSADGRRIFFAMKQSLAPGEITNLRKAIEQGRVSLKHELILSPTYPVISLKAFIFDNPRDPFWIETFPNVGGAERPLLLRLVSTREGPGGICFHFFDTAGSVVLRAGNQSVLPIAGLEQDIAKADQYLESLPASVRNYRAATQHYLRETS